MVPLECQKVQIPAGSKVLIPPGITGKCETFEVDTNAVFDVKLTGLFEAGQ